MTNLQAAVGIAQLERIEEVIARRRLLASYYEQGLAGVSGIRLQAKVPYAKPVYWMYAVQLDKALDVDAAAMMTRLKGKGIGTRPFFLGLHAQPILQKLGLFKGEKLPQTDRANQYGVYLPSSLTLTKPQIDLVSEAVKEALQKG